MRRTWPATSPTMSALPVSRWGSPNGWEHRRSLSNFSRLVIDPNRGEDDPTLVMKLYDGTIIPANRAVDAAETPRRLDAYHRPYPPGGGRASRRTARAASRSTPFPSHRSSAAGRPGHGTSRCCTPQDRRLADPLLARLRREHGLVVGANEPYTGALAGDSIDRHATAHGRPNALVEVRNDLHFRRHRTGRMGRTAGPLP